MSTDEQLVEAVDAALVAIGRLRTLGRDDPEYAAAFARAGKAIHAADDLFNPEPF